MQTKHVLAAQESLWAETLDAYIRRPSLYTKLVSARVIWVLSWWSLLQWGDSLSTFPISVNDPLLDHLFILSNIY